MDATTTAAADVNVNKGMPNFGRPNALDHYPFNDDGEVQSMLFALPSDTPHFMDVGVPLRKRLAATVYKELCTGKAGLSVGDIPAALTALGFDVEPELEKAFRGRSRENPVGMEAWLKVVKRFVTREEMRKEVSHSGRTVCSVIGSDSASIYKSQGSTKKQTFNAAENRSDGKDLFRNVQQELLVGEKIGNTSIAASLANLNTNAASKWSHSYYDRYPSGHTSPAASDCSDVSAMMIAESFLSGPVAKDVYGTPVGWWEAKEVPKKNEEAMRKLATELGIDARSREGGFDSDSDADGSAEAVVLQSLSLIDGGREQQESFALKYNIDPDTKKLSLKKKVSSEAEQKRKLANLKKDVAHEIADRHEDGKVMDGWHCKSGGWVTDFKSYPAESKTQGGNVSSMLTGETMHLVVDRVKEMFTGHKDSVPSCPSNASAMPLRASNSSSSDKSTSNISASVTTANASATASVVGGSGTVTASIVPSDVSSSSS
jgi:hypothetical protein